METKLRWLQSAEVTSPILKKFSAAIAEHPFTKDKTRGFLVSKTRPASISAKFIEKVSGKRELTDPFGNRLQLPFVTYDVIQFRLSSEFPHLELLNAPKSPRKFFFFLTEITGEAFAMSPVDVDLKKWISAISAVIGKLAVTEIYYRDLMVTPSVAADIAFYGAGDVVGDARDFVGQRSAIVAKAKLSVKIDNRDASFEVSRIGGLRANVVLDARQVDELRGTLVVATGKR